MAEQADAIADPMLTFGPFRLRPAQPTLFKGDRPVRLGSRALDILPALLDRPGDLVGKDVLVAPTWPGITVDETRLRVLLGAARGDQPGRARAP